MEHGHGKCNDPFLGFLRVPRLYLIDR